MHIICPHCQVPIDVVLKKALEAVICPSCGSSFSLYDEETLAFSEKPPEKIGKFELLDHLGVGRFGDVYRARDTVLGRNVAVKLPRVGEIDSGSVGLFVREARSAAQLQHDNIVKVYDVGSERDLVYIVSELINGTNLREWQTLYKPTFEQAADFCATIADALHHAHSQKIYHRDLKPSNVLIDEAGKLYLTDFGLSKRESAEFTITTQGRVIGTPAYMPPEQARGEGHYADARSDVYSLGVMLYEMLTRKRPFEGGNKQLLLHQVQFADPPRPRTIDKAIPRDLETICLAALEKEPGKRYQTAAEMRDDLRRFTAGLPIKRRPVSRRERAWRWARRNPMTATLLVITCGALAAVMLMAFTAPPPIDPEARWVQIAADQPGASLVFMPLGAIDGRPRPKSAITGLMPGEVPARLRLRPGQYWVVAHSPDKRAFHEVFRTVPPKDAPARGGAYKYRAWTTEPDGSINLPKVALFTNENVLTSQVPMANLMRRDDFTMGRSDGQGFPGLPCRIPSFFLDSRKVTVGDWKKAWRFLPDPVNRQPPPDDQPITNIIYDKMVDHAEGVGKRLLDEAEFEFAQTFRGTRRISAVDAKGITVADDRLDYDVPVFGLRSNPLELTSTWFHTYVMSGDHAIHAAPESRRVVRGGVFEDDRKPGHETVVGTLQRLPFLLNSNDPNVGFRCGRSEKPRLKPNDFPQVALTP